jgi:hypothetical protein
MTHQSKIADILQLIEDCRYTAAYNECKAFISSDGVSLDEDFRNLLTETESRRIATMLDRAREVQIAIDRSSDSSESDGSSWLLGSILFGISTYYMKVGDNDIIVKMEGTMHDLPIFEQCAVIHEVDLFKTWIPLCEKSILIEKISKAELVA